MRWLPQEWNRKLVAVLQLSAPLRVKRRVLVGCCAAGHEAHEVQGGLAAGMEPEVGCG